MPRTGLLLALLASLPALAAPPAVEKPLVSERPTVDFGVGYRGFLRTFGLDSGGTTLPRFDGSGASVAVEAKVFPFASVTSGVGGNLGLIGEGAFSVGLSGSYQGHEFPAAATTVRGALALRLPFDASEVLLHVGVGYQAFTLATASTDGAGHLVQADPAFLGPRFGVGYQLQAARWLKLQLRAAFLYTVSRGQLDTLYPAASALGVDAAAQVAFILAPAVQLRLFGDFARTWVTLTTRAGATEQQLGGGVGFALAL